MAKRSLRAAGPVIGTVVTFGAVLLGSGCTLFVYPSRVISGSRYVAATSSDDVMAQARHNLELLNEYRSRGEWRLHRSAYDGHGERAPHLCVALSGGGIRSAAFAIGVMKGLHDTPVDGGAGESILHDVDVLSATSGGAYALSWYYMQHLVRPRDDTLFNVDGPAQQQLYDRGAHFYRKWQYPIVWSGNLLLAPFNLLVNGAWGWHLNTSWFGYSYDYAIRHTFHDDQKARLDDLLPVVRDQQLPYFVITSTVRLDEDENHQDALFALTVFEMTPLKWGSDAYKFYPIDTAPLNVAEAVAIAGSAPDSTQIFAGASQRVVGSALNFDVGRFLPNPAYRPDGVWPEVQRALSYAAPLPFYFIFPEYHRDANGRNVYVSDGGHQENLAAFPLIRRMCDSLIIVDGEYDPDYHFGSYFKLKHAVEREMGVTMRMDPVPGVSSAATPRQDIDSLDPTPATHGTSAQVPFDPAVPVMTGEIGAFPIMNDPGIVSPDAKADHGVVWKTIPFAYVKLSLDGRPFEQWDVLKKEEQDALSCQYGPALVDYHIKSTKNRCETADCFVPCDFPQLSTIHQALSPAQFRAYVELGAMLVRRHVSYDGTNVCVDCEGHDDRHDVRKACHEPESPSGGPRRPKPARG